jgi:hypothetical protein
MRLTPRDAVVLKDLGLSHCLARDQLLRLGHFHSITRVNTRMRDLAGQGFVSRLTTPFYGQSIYTLGQRGLDVVGERIARLVRRRAESPRFLQHALAVTEVRIALVRKYNAEWRFEQQLWRRLPEAHGCELRPDGLLLTSIATFVEVDLGNAAPAKFREKLTGYELLAATTSSSELYGFAKFQLLTVTTAPLRARHLQRLTPPTTGFEHRVRTFEEVGVAPIASWS